MVQGRSLGARSAACSALAALQLRRLQCADENLPLDDGFHQAQFIGESVSHVGTPLCPGPRKTAQTQGPQQNLPELPPAQQDHLDLACRRLLQQRMRRSALLCNMQPTRVALMSLEQGGPGRGGTAAGASRAQEAGRRTSCNGQPQQPSAPESPVDLPWVRLANLGHQAGKAAALVQTGRAAVDLPGEVPLASTGSVAATVNATARLEPGRASSSGPGSSGEPGEDPEALLAQIVQALCKNVEPGLVPAVQLLRRAEVRLRSRPSTEQQHQQQEHQRQQHQQQGQQSQHHYQQPHQQQQLPHAVVVTPEDEAMAIRIMLAWLQHGLVDSSSSSSSSCSSSTLSPRTSSPAGNGASAAAAQGQEHGQERGEGQEQGRGDGTPGLVASLVSQLRGEREEEHKAGGTADMVRPCLAVVRRPGARVDLRDVRALAVAAQPGDWAAALEAAEEGDRDMHDVLSSAVMGTLVTGQYRTHVRCGQRRLDLLTNAAVPLMLSIAQDVDRCAEAAAQLPSRLIHTAVHCLPTPLLTWLLHVISSTELPEDVLAFVTIGPAGQPSATGNGPGQGACTGTRHSTQPAAGIPPQLDPVKAERLLRARYFGGHQTTGVGPAGALPQVSVGLASFTLVRVFFIEAAIRRYPVALGALVMAWEERAGRQQHAQAEAERLGGPAGTALDGPPLAHSERVLLAAIQWERRRMQQQRQQRGQQQREGAGRVRSTGEGQQPQGAGAGDAGRRWDPSQQEQQQQQHEGEGAGAHGSLAGSLLQLRRTGQQYPELRHLAHEVSATCQPAGLTPAVDPETAAMYMWMYKLLSDVTSQLEPLYGRGSMPRTVVERAADMLVGVAEGPHGRVLLGGSCCREYPVVDAVLAELEAAAVRVSEQLLPYTPVGVLLHGAWCASENDHVHRMGVTDRWCKEGQGQGKAAGPGRQRRRVLDLARSWEVAAAEVGAAVEVLRPGLLEDPVSGPAWKLAVALAGRVDEAEELPDVLLQYALAGLSLVAGHDLSLGRLQLCPCAVAGLYYDHYSQASTSPHAEKDAIRAAIPLLMVLSYVPLIPDIPFQPPQPPDACAASQPPQPSPPQTTEGPAVSNPIVANLQLAEHHRAAMGLLKGLGEFVLDPEECTAEVACVYDAVTATAQRDGQAPSHSQQGGSLLYGHSFYPATHGAGAQLPRAVCGATQDRVLAAAKLQATRPYRPGRRWDCLVPVGAVQGTTEGVCGNGGTDGGSSRSGGVQGYVEQGEGQGHGQAGTAGAGAMGRGVRVLRPAMRSSELLAAVLGCVLPGGGGQQEQPAGGGAGRRGQGQGVQQQLPVRAVACGAEQLALLVLATHRISDVGGCYSGTVFQPSVDTHLANVLLAGDRAAAATVTEEAAYNPPPGATSVTVLDVHYRGAISCSSDPAVQAARTRHQLEKVTDKFPRFSDALRRLREALVDKPRVSATWVVAQGVGGLQRALLMVAKVREELLAQHRDLTVWVVSVAHSSEAMDAAELEQREQQQRLKEQQQQENQQLQQQSEVVSRGGKGAAAPKARGAARDSGRGSWLEGPWMSRELRELHWNLCATLDHLAHQVGLGHLQVGEDGSIGVMDAAARWELEQAEGLLAAMLRLLRDPGCVVHEHVRVELLLQEVALGRVDMLVPGREEARAAEAATRGAGGKRAADGAGRKHTRKELQKFLFR